MEKVVLMTIEEIEKQLEDELYCINQDWIDNISFLLSEVKRLREGIEKHRNIKQELVDKYNYNSDPTNNILLTLDECDEELYKLLEYK